MRHFTEMTDNQTFFPTFFYFVVSLHSVSVHDLFDTLLEASATGLPDHRFINKPGCFLFITFKKNIRI